MFNIFVIELKKVFLQKKTYIIWSVLILTLLLNYHVNILDSEHNVSISLNNASNIENANQNLQNIKSRLEEGKLSDKDKIKFQEYLKNTETEISNFNIIQDNNKDDMTKIKAKIDIVKSKLFEISEGKLITGIPVSDYNKELRFLQYLYDNKIPESRLGQNSFKYMFNFLNDPISILFILVVILLGSDFITKEIEESTIKLMLVQPVSRFKILTAKYLALITSIVAIVITTFFAAFIIVGIKDGIGNPAFPYINDMKYSFDNVFKSYKYIEGTGIYISSSTLLFKLLIFFLLACITSASISFMISVLSNTSTISMSIGIIINIGLIYIVFSTSILKNFKQYIYVTYWSSYNIFSGKIAETLNNGHINPLLGIIQMIVISLVTYTISCVVFIKKDI